MDQQPSHVKRALNSIRYCTIKKTYKKQWGMGWGVSGGVLSGGNDVDKQPSQVERALKRVRYCTIRKTYFMARSNCATSAVYTRKCNNDEN